MKRCIATLLVTAAGALPAFAQDAGWTPLFDGQSLDGWVQRIEPIRPDNRPEEEIQTWVNGQPVTDAELPEATAKQPKGFLGLQVHEIMNDRPAEVRWRNLRIRELSANSQPPTP